MPYLKATVDASDLRKVATWVGSLESILDDPEVMQPAVYALGKRLGAEFAHERGPDGPWRVLSNTTRKARGSRSYPEDHPILEQSGGLYRAAIAPLTNWNRYKPSTQVFIPADSRAKNSSGTSFVGSISHRTFTATIRGSKVMNQYGGMEFFPSSRDTGNNIYGTERYVPARPFWYITQAIADNMLPGVLNNLESLWTLRSGGIAKHMGDWFAVSRT